MVTLFLGLGYGVEKLFNRLFLRKYFKFTTNEYGGLSIDAGKEQLCSVDKLSSTFVRIVPDFLGLIVFTGFSFLVYFAFAWTTSAFLQLFFIATLLTITLIRAMIILSGMVFSPTILQFRVLPLHCGTANTLHKLLVWTGSYMIIAIMFSIVAYKLGAQYETLKLLQLISASALLFVTAGATIFYRKTVKQQLLMAAEGEPSWGRKTFADIWHILALAYTQRSRI